MQEPRNSPVVIEAKLLSPEALENLIDSFILREGTDYGSAEVSLERKREQILNQLSQDEIKIVFDPDSASVTLVPKRQLKTDFGF